MQFCIQQFDNEDLFNKLNWESEYIRAVDFESDEEEIRIYRYKQRLSTKKIPKKKKLVFMVFIESFIEGNEKDFCFLNQNEFKTEEKAIDFFDTTKQNLKWWKEKDKENKIFDGRRYLWEIKDKKLTGKKSWN